MRPQKGLPRHPLPPKAGGIEPVLEQNPLDRIAPDLVAEIVERTSNSGVAPARIIASHLDDEPLDLNRRLGTPGPTRLAAIVFPGNQTPIPAKQGVWRDQSADLEEPSAADRLGPDREATALAIGQEQASITELLAEHPVLRLQVFDDVLLGAIDPSREDQDQKLKLESAHPRERTPGSESDAGPKAAAAPAFRTLESFTFRIGRLLAHYEE